MTDHTEERTRMPLYLPDEDRRAVLRNYGAHYQLDAFIETGTFTGDTVAALSDRFKVLHTIELDPELHLAAEQRFITDPHIHCWYGDSAVVLPRVFDVCPEPALFWLDGHYCGPGSGRGSIDTPVQQELTLIFSQRSVGDVVLVDDARIFGGGPEEGWEGHTGYPTLDWVAELAHDSGYHYELLDDIIRLVPAS